MNIRHRANGTELKIRKETAIRIYNKYKDDINYTREDITKKIKEELGIPAWGARRLVVSLGLFEKRVSVKNTISQNPNTLICPKCGDEKEKTEFPKRGKDRQGDVRYSYCKSCHSSYQRIMQLKRLYGITKEEYIKLGDVCTICGRKGKTHQNPVDHDHKTGLIRGRICTRCNRGLAWFMDNPILLRKCADYLENPPAISILGKEVYGRVGRVSKRRGKKKKYAKSEPVYILDSE